MDWKEWENEQPLEGNKIVIVCDDGCSSSLALMGQDGPLDGEDGSLLGEAFLRGAIWAELPESYPLGFMEVTEDDWY